MKHFILSCFLIVLIPIDTFASVFIESLLPNPTGDDTLGEYIEIRNIGCESVDISGYTLSDLSGKIFTIPDSSTLLSHESRKFSYGETKIALNNSGEESISLKSPEGSIIDSYTYSGNQKEDVILQVSLTDYLCNTSLTGELDGAQSASGNSYTGDILDVELSGTGETGNNNFFTGSTATGSSESGFFTGSVFYGSGSSVFSGAVLSGSGEGSPLPYTESGLLLAQSLYYSDSDKNGRIDTLEIVYPYILTGSIDKDAIYLYSSTGGLYDNHINTASGYIHDASLSGNILILSIREGDKEKVLLKINNTTTSDLRLKSSGDLGFRSIGGKIPEPFFLTSSFANYTTVSSRYYSPRDTYSGLSQSGNTLIQSEVANTGSISFPEIFPTLQSPTNALFSGGTFICTSSDCRINITLEPIFSSGFSMKNFTCGFGTGESIILDTDCNPNTFYFTSSGVLDIELISKSSPLVKKNVSYTIEWRISSSGGATLGGNQNSPIPIISDVGKPVAKIEIDGKWKEYYEQIGDYELNCYAFTCSINFTAENSYDPENNMIRFLWIYGRNDISLSRDPGGKKYGLGDHTITLRVIDESGNYDEVHYSIHVLGPKSKAEKIKISSQEKSKKSSKKIQGEILASQKQKKAKKLKMVFFSSPSLILQGRTGKSVGQNTYICEYKKKPECGINFTLSETLKGYEYIWYLDDTEIYKGKNPKIWKLSPGSHTMKIVSIYKNSDFSLHEASYAIIVKSVPKKSKKIAKSKKSPKKNSQKITNIIPQAYAENKNTPSENSSSFPGAIIFIAGILGGYILRRRKI